MATQRLQAPAAFLRRWHDGLRLYPQCYQIVRQQVLLVAAGPREVTLRLARRLTRDSDARQQLLHNRPPLLAQGHQGLQVQGRQAAPRQHAQHSPGHIQRLLILRPPRHRWCQPAGEAARSAQGAGLMGRQAFQPPMIRRPAGGFRDAVCGQQHEGCCSGCSAKSKVLTSRVGPCRKPGLGLAQALTRRHASRVERASVPGQHFQWGGKGQQEGPQRAQSLQASLGKACCRGAEHRLAAVRQGAAAVRAQRSHSLLDQHLLRPPGS